MGRALARLPLGGLGGASVLAPGAPAGPPGTPRGSPDLQDAAAGGPRSTTTQEGKRHISIKSVTFDVFSGNQNSAFSGFFQAPKGPGGPKTDSSGLAERKPQSIIKIRALGRRFVAIFSFFKFCSQTPKPLCLCAFSFP